MYFHIGMSFRKTRIRGVIASASLKPLAYVPERLRTAEYPRRYCLGLIEAHLPEIGHVLN